jgi:hypothetical protein
MWFGIDLELQVLQLFFTNKHKEDNTMKRLFLMMAIVLLGAQEILAQGYAGAMLKVRDIEGRRIFIVVDGKPVATVGRVVVVPRIKSGQHNLRVYKTGYNGRPIVNPQFLIYTGTISLRNGYVYRCSVDDYESLSIQEFCCLDNGGIYQQPNSNQNQWGTYDDHDMYWENNTWTGQQSMQQIMTPMCMTDAQFDMFLRTLNNTSFENSKAQIVRTQLANTFVSTAQLKTIVDQFDFESNKLNVAKSNVERVVDPQNIFLLYDAFTFDNNRNQLAQYIQTLANNPNSNFSRNLALAQQQTTTNGWNSGGGNNGWGNGNGNGNGWNNTNNGNHFGHDHDHDHQGQNNGYSNNYNSGGGNGYGNYSPMDNNSFAAFLQTLRNNNFDNGKATLVRTQLMSSYITSAQLRQILEVFSFDSGKLDIAKFAATRVVDRQNLFTVYDAFGFESSKQNFAEFVAKLK